MNTFKTVSALALSISLLSSAAYADKRTKVQEVKSGATFAAATVVGAVAGGPIGMVLGAIGGMYLGEQGKKQVEQEIELEASTMALTQFEQQIDQQEIEIGSLEKMIEEKMQFQMHFKTGDDKLSKEDSEQIRALSDFMKDNEYMHVAVDGHTDPRGTDEYNNVLSHERAKAVAAILEQNGIDPARISTRGHGSSFSKNATSADDYAQLRKVKVQVFSSKGGANLASAN